MKLSIGLMIISRLIKEGKAIKGFIFFLVLKKTRYEYILFR